MTNVETGTSDEAQIQAIAQERIAAMRERDAARLAATYAPGS